jgi:hypothetical protein
MIPKDARSVYYIGGSMYPSFRNKDRLVYVPYGGRKIEPGDVVVMDAPDGRKVVHRVLRIDGDKIATMGDSCLNPDSWLLSPEEVAGQVVYACRGGKQWRVHGGLRGRVYAAPVRRIRTILNILYRLSGRFCDLLAGSMAFNLLSPNPKFLAFQRPEGKEMQILMGRYVIGRRRPGGQWQIMPPFKLFLKKETLDNSSEKSDIRVLKTR